MRTKASFFLLACTMALLIVSCARDNVSSASGEPGVEAIIDAFETYDAIFLSEDHQNKEVHDFINSLLRNPRFLDAVDDIAVESGNALYQDLIDRYVRGDDLTIDDITPVWRNTTQWLVWDSPLYQEFFELVRAVNADRPEDKKIRVLLLDPPIDWSTIKTADDYGAAADRNTYERQTIINKSLALGRKSLTIIGGAHITARSPQNDFAQKQPDEIKSTGQFVKEAAPGRVLTIWSLVGPDYREALSLPTSPDGTLYWSKSPLLATQSFSNVRLNKTLAVQREVDGELVWVGVPNETWPPISDMVDALLFVSDTNTTVEAPIELYRNPAYETELRRRAKILEEFYGFEFERDLDEILTQ